MPTPQETALALIAEVKRDYKPQPIADDSLMLTILEKIPFVSRRLNQLKSASDTLSRLIKVVENTSNTATETAKAMPIVGLVLNAIDFIQTPVLYLGAFIAGVKLPFSLTKTSQWLYSSVLLGLTLTAILAPVVAPIMMVTTASFVLATSVITLGRIYYQRNKDKKELTGVTQQIELIANEATLLNEACKDNNETRIKELTTAFQSHIIAGKSNLTDTLQSLHNTKDLLTKKIDIEAHVINNCAGVAFASLGLVGAVVSLFFPLVGLSLLITATLASATYIIAPFAASQVVHLGNWIKGVPDGALPQEHTVNPTPQNKNASIQKDASVIGCSSASATQITAALINALDTPTIQSASVNTSLPPASPSPLHPQGDQACSPDSTPSHQNGPTTQVP